MRKLLLMTAMSLASILSAHAYGGVDNVAVNPGEGVDLYKYTPNVNTLFENLTIYTGKARTLSFDINNTHILNSSA